MSTGQSMPHVDELFIQNLIQDFVISGVDHVIYDDVRYNKDDFLRIAYKFAQAKISASKRSEIKDLTKLLGFYKTDLTRLGLDIDLLAQLPTAKAITSSNQVSNKAHGVALMPGIVRSNLLSDNGGQRKLGFITSAYILFALLKNKRIKLEMKDCWKMLGFTTEITKADQLRYNQTSNLAKRASRIYNIIKAVEGPEWDELFAHVLEVDFEEPNRCSHLSWICVKGKSLEVELQTGKDFECFLNTLAGNDLVSQLGNQSLFCGRLPEREQKDILAKIELLLRSGDDFCRSLLENEDASPYTVIYKLLKQRSKPNTFGVGSKC